MERHIFKKPFRNTGFLSYKCPICNKGLLRIKEDSFLFNETIESKMTHQEPDFNYTCVNYLYSCILICSDCDEIITSNGYGKILEDASIDQDGEPVFEYTNYFYPKYFFPPLNIITIPFRTPETIKSELLKSFELFFCEPSSSLNHIRISLEELLNVLNVKKYTITKKDNKNKRAYINLHHRIQMLQKPYDKHKDHLLALKWLGNAGSHGGNEITIDDLLDALEILEHILEQLYVKNTDKISKLVKKINKKEGPIKRKSF